MSKISFPAFMRHEPYLIYLSKYKFQGLKFPYDPIARYQNSWLPHANTDGDTLHLTKCCTSYLILFPLVRQQTKVG